MASVVFGRKVVFVRAASMRCGIASDASVDSRRAALRPTLAFTFHGQIIALALRGISLSGEAAARIHPDGSIPRSWSRPRY